METAPSPDHGEGRHMVSDINLLLQSLWAIVIFVTDENHSGRFFGLNYWKYKGLHLELSVRKAYVHNIYYVTFPMLISECTSPYNGYPCALLNMTALPA